MGKQYFLLCLLLVCVGNTRAQDSDWSLSCSYVNPVTVATVSFTAHQQANVGDIIGDWNYDIFTDYYQCAYQPAPGYTWALPLGAYTTLPRRSFRVPFSLELASLPLVVGPDGNSYQVYKVPSIPGLGYIVKADWVTQMDMTPIDISVIGGEKHLQTGGSILPYYLPDREYKSCPT